VRCLARPSWTARSWSQARGASTSPPSSPRLHPSASRVARLSREIPASYVVFDLLSDGDEDLRPRPFGERRARLEALLAGARPPLHLTPATGDPSVARAWLEHLRQLAVDPPEPPEAPAAR
jgi:hypothetical protein